MLVRDASRQAKRLCSVFKSQNGVRILAVPHSSYVVCVCEREREKEKEGGREGERIGGRHLELQAIHLQNEVELNIKSLSYCNGRSWWSPASDEI